MGKMTFITGGARSGKSTFAEQLAKETKGIVTYIATAIPFDDGMKDRIKKHRQQRPAEWATIEKYRDFQDLKDHPDFIQADTILLDCLTVLITNQMMDFDADYDTISMAEFDDIENAIHDQIGVLLDVLEASDKEIIIVANELGLGLTPPYRLGSLFRDVAGRVNQRVAARADHVYFTVSGIPMKIK